MGWRLRWGFSQIAGTRRGEVVAATGGGWLGGFIVLRQRRWFKCGFQTHRRRMQGGEAFQKGFANFICLSNFASVGPTCWNALLGLLMLRLSEVLSQPMSWRVVGGADWRSTSVSAAVLQGPRSPSSLRLARSGHAYGLGCSLEGGGRRGGGGGGLEARVGWRSPSEPAFRGLFWRAASPQGAWHHNYATGGS